MTEPVAGITVAGRTFRPVTSLTFEQYNWVVSHLWTVDTDGADTLQRLLARVSESGESSSVLAGLLVEEIDGVVPKWTPAAACEVKRCFEEVADFEECSKLQTELLRRLPGFFPGVVDSWADSATSSDSTSTTPASISEAQKNDDPPTPSVSSASQSVPSLATT